MDPSKEEARSVLLHPLDMLVSSVNTFNCLETELMSLLKLKKPAPYPISYPLTRDEEIICSAERTIIACLDAGFAEIQAILDSFSRFAFLYEKSSDRVVSALFPDRRTAATASGAPTAAAATASTGTATATAVQPTAYIVDPKDKRD